MKKQELHSLVQECIAEVLDEKYTEFQRVDKGDKDVAAKDKGEEDVYGAGYAAGERAAKAKYKKLAEAYKALKGANQQINEVLTNDNLIYSRMIDMDHEQLISSILEFAESNPEVKLVDYLNSEWGYEEDLDEARFKKGEDIGEPGPGFKKVAKAAEKQYGSKEAGQKVAGAILKKVLKK